MIPIDIRITVNPFPGLKGEMPEAMRRGLAMAGTKWHREMLEGHFETSAQTKYGYKPRTKHYMLKKARQHHHQKPLVFTGTMRDALMRAATIRSTRHNVKVDMTGPKWLAGFVAMRGRTGTGPNKGAEITAATNEEVQVLADYAADIVAKRLENAKARRSAG